MVVRFFMAKGKKIVVLNLTVVISLSQFLIIYY